MAASVANWVYIEPKATDLMFERYALENAPGEKDAAQIKALYKSFGKFHGISSLLNLVSPNLVQVLRESPRHLVPPQLDEATGVYNSVHVLSVCSEVPNSAGNPVHVLAVCL